MRNFFYKNNFYHLLKLSAKSFKIFLFDSRIFYDVFEIISIKIASFNDSQKEYVLVLDELFLTEGINYEVAFKSFIGSVTLPEHKGIDNHGLVFMLSEIFSQTIA